MLRVGASSLLFVCIASLAGLAQQDPGKQLPSQNTGLFQFPYGPGLNAVEHSPTGLVVQSPRVVKELDLSQEQEAKFKEFLDQYRRTRETMDKDHKEKTAQFRAAKNVDELIRANDEHNEKAKSLIGQTDDYLVRKLLSRDQAARLQQIQLQAEGAYAFKRPEVRERLGLDDEQAQQINRIVFEGARQLRAAARFPQDLVLPKLGGDPETPEAKAFTVASRTAKYRVVRDRRATLSQIEQVLTNAQRATFKIMLGKPFNFLESETGPPYRVLAQDKGKLAIVDPSGKIEWEVPLRFTAHDVQLLPNGNILVPTDNVTIVEMTPDKKVVWKHVSKAKEPYKGAVEIHAFQRLPDGRTMVAETGNKRIIEVDAEDKIVKEIPLLVDKPNSHRDTRRARKLSNGHYLVCHELDGVVREYDDTGKVVWSYALDLAGRPAKGGHDGHGTEVFNAIRKPDGNTIIAGGNNNRVIEVSPDGKIVWSIDNKELPGIELFWVTSLQLRPNGNLIFGNTHAGPSNPQLIEVTRDKKVVWTFHDFKNFGNDLCASQVINVEEGVIR